MAEVKYLIIGDGMAGATAAQEIRHMDARAEIVIVGDEGDSFYYRASMSEWIAGEVTEEMLPGRTLEFYDH
jgi:NAD(P)H-nitrite reductase large subunit